MPPVPPIPSVSNLPSIPLPSSTGVERIFAAYHDEHGPGLKGLSKEDKQLHKEMEAAYAMILDYQTFDMAWPLLAQMFNLSRATCYRRLKDAQNLFGNVKKVQKEGRRNVLMEYARKIAYLCMAQRPINVKGAMQAMKFEADLAGLLRADAHGEEAGPGTGNASYILNLTVQGRKPKQYDLANLDDVDDAEFEIIQEAIGENLVGDEQMAGLLAQAKEGNGRL